MWAESRPKASRAGFGTRNGSRTTLVGVLLVCLCGGCRLARDVTFAYLNLSGTAIYVESVSGFSVDPSPGYLGPSTSGTNRYEQASATFFEPVQVAEELNLHWKEDDSPRRVTVRRADAGLPPRLTYAHVRFTYLGSNNWQVSSLPATAPVKE
jgi:hypothetical protein